MRCWNCNRKIPRKAAACKYCEAPVQPGPSAGEMKAVGDMLQQMPPEALAELDEVLSKSGTAEEFVNRIFVGNCPQCDSENTGDCESDPEINELLVGRCYDCGQLWCTECLRLLTVEAPRCSCWEEEE